VGTTTSAPRERAALRPEPPLAALALLGTLTGCAAATESLTAEQPGGTSAQEPAAIDADYRDGRYRADGPYLSPAGDESMIVVVQLQNDLVTGVEIGLYPTSATSSTYQAQFASGIADLVVGRDIDALDVTVVAGSSLTSTGFRNALTAIKTQGVEN
jgi:hypothetical protein